eukprot:6180691-Pleurochrysis_carterae.AAC.6
MRKQHVGRSWLRREGGDGGGCGWRRKGWPAGRDARSAEGPAAQPLTPLFKRRQKIKSTASNHTGVL